MVPKLLILWMSTQDVGATRSAALLQSLRAALGEQVVLQLRGPPEERAAADAPSAVVAYVRWSSPWELELEVRPGGQGSVRTQHLRFTPGDPEAEVGRAAGLLLAAMLPEYAPPTAEAALPSPPAERGRLSVELSAQGVLGLGRNASGGGGEVASRLLFQPRLFARVSAGVRFGAVPDAAGNSLRAGVGLGGGWGAVERPHWGLAVRLEGLLLYESVSRAEEGRRARWIPGARMALEADLRSRGPTSLFAGVGMEAAFGETALYVDDAYRGGIAPLRAMAELGVRFQL